MPSPVRDPRQAVELLLRVAAIGVLAWALWLAARPLATGVTRERVAADALGERLRAWTRDGAPDSVRLTIDSLPDDSLLDWLVAVRRTGAAVAWSGDVGPLALGVEPVNAPSGGARLLVAAPADSAIVARDAAGPVGTIRATGGGGAARVPALAEPATARLGATSARVGALDSLIPGPVLLLATAGWEARYVTAALEESGWRVDARLTIAPGLEVRRGAPGAIDTARYAAVVALDSGASAHARRVAAYVRAGGGVVMSGVAAALPGLREIAPGAPGARVRPEVVSFAADAPRRALSFLPILRMRADALALEARGDRPVVAARRGGIGRVLQVGYDETWRWRMQGGEEGLEAHRRWWSDAIAAVALRRSLPVESSGISRRAAAPRAAAFATLGPPSGAEAMSAQPSTHRTLHPWMLVLSLVLLLAEWTSRRLRGAA